MAEKQAIGPRQEEWLTALESGGYAQCDGHLHDGVGYCCLGVACKLADIEPKAFALGDGTKRYMFEGERNYPPPQVVERLALWTMTGELDNHQEDLGHETLADANDSGKSFAKIAAFCREHPEAVFTEPR
jgi:hypothetical protein